MSVCVSVCVETALLDCGGQRGKRLCSIEILKLTTVLAMPLLRSREEEEEEEEKEEETRITRTRMRMMMMMMVIKSSFVMVKSIL